MLHSLLNFIIVLSLCSVLASNSRKRIKRFDWHDEGKLNWALNCDWTGGDLKNVASTGDKCGDICISIAGCTHFTWTSYNDGTCWLKQGGTSLDQAVYKDGPSSCGMLKSGPPPPQPAGGNVRGTMWADTTDVGGCQMPAGDYAINNALALGQSPTLGNLVWRQGLCGQVLRVTCGSGSAVEAVVASTCNLGSPSCGVDMIKPTWNLATGNQQPGETQCTVELTRTNPLRGDGPVCYRRPNSETQAYYASLGVFNVEGRIVKSASAAGVNGIFQQGSGWFDFNSNGRPLFTDDAQVEFAFEDGTTSSFKLSDCKVGGQVHIWS